jgi:succinyldiaminopimelate transaminase
MSKRQRSRLKSSLVAAGIIGPMSAVPGVPREVALNGAITRLKPYAFTQLRARQDELAAQGTRVINFGVGDPEDDTPAFIREALIAAIKPSSRYPTAAGISQLREAIAGWLGRRFGVTVHPDRHVMPANGAKEALYNLTSLVVDSPGTPGRRDLIAIPELAYQVYGDAAVLHHAEVFPIPLGADWLPDLDAITPEVGRRLAILWLNSPHNPTGAVAPRAHYRRALDLADRYGFLVASDEAYSELWFDAPPAGILEACDDADFTGAIAINTLSKRSNMTGYRSGLIAGDARVIAAMRNVRPRIGVATPEFVQRAAIAAWHDEAHVEAQRARYAGRRDLFLDLCARKAIQIEASQGAFYLWIRVPEYVPGRDATRFAETLLNHGIVVLPGSFMGPRGSEYVRLAFVPSLETCTEAVAILDRVL